MQLASEFSPEEKYTHKIGAKSRVFESLHHDSGLNALAVVRSSLLEAYTYAN